MGREIRNRLFCPFFLHYKITKNLYITQIYCVKNSLKIPPYSLIIKIIEVLNANELNKNQQTKSNLSDKFCSKLEKVSRNDTTKTLQKRMVIKKGEEEKRKRKKVECFVLKLLIFNNLPQNYSKNTQKMAFSE